MAVLGARVSVTPRDPARDKGKRDAGVQRSPGSPHLPEETPIPGSTKEPLQPHFEQPAGFALQHSAARTFRACAPEDMPAPVPFGLWRWGD